MSKKTLIVEGEDVTVNDDTPSIRVDDALAAALADWRTAQRDLAQARNAAANLATRLQQLDDELSAMRLQASQRPSVTFADFEAVKDHARQSALLQAEIDGLQAVRVELVTELGKRQSEVFGFELLVGDSRRGCWSALLNQLKAKLPADVVNELPNVAIMAGLSRSELTDFLLPSEDSDQCFGIAKKYGIPA